MSRLAVVIPCFNLGRTVREAFDSVLAQTRPAAEIVVVDDGSTDVSTRMVLSSLPEAQARIVRTPNGGPAAARNHGVRLTSAEYVVLLDADDYLDPIYLQRTAERLDAAPDLGFVSTAIQAFEGASYQWTPPPCDLLSAVTRGTVHPATMFRRRLWEAVGGFDEDPALRSCEDLDFWITAMERGFRGEVLTEALLHYRVRSDSLYHAGVSNGSHARALEAVLRKHRSTIENLGPPVLIAKERFARVDQLNHVHHLAVEKARLQSEINALDGEIRAISQTLQAHGREPLDWREFRQLESVGAVAAQERGTPIDRYYAEAFLRSNRGDMRGRVVQITSWHPAGAEGAVEGGGEATLVADLSGLADLRSSSIDCVALVNVLQTQFDVRDVIAQAARILRPGGILLCTVPAVAHDPRHTGDYWGFTGPSASALLAEAFPEHGIDVIPYGNALACTALLFGVVAEDLRQEDIDDHDDSCPVLFGLRGVKATGHSRAERSRENKVNVAGILLYHRIVDLKPDVHRLCVGEDEFRAQMEHLRRAYRPTPLVELVRAGSDGELPAGSVAITFDDGYLDALDVAVPILQDLELPATFFVNTDRLQEEHEFWWDTLERIFLGEHSVPPLLMLEFGERRLQLRTETMAERAETHAVLREAVYTMSAAERDGAVQRVAQWSRLPLPVRRTHRPMTGAELRRLAASPLFSIGAHTTHHLVLWAQQADVLRREVVEHKRELETWLGRPVPTFAYPYGEFDERVVDVVREASFQAAVTTERRVFIPGEDPLVLPRVGIMRCPVEEFAGLMGALLGGGRR